MSKKKNARSTAATMGRAIGSAAFAEAANSRPNRTTAAGAGQLKIADFLLTGAENAIDGATLAAALGCKRRELTRWIETERRGGAPICAAVSGKTRGYFLTESVDEMRRYIRSLNRRIREVQATRDACGETLRQMYGQEIMEGWNG